MDVFRTRLLDAFHIFRRVILELSLTSLRFFTHTDRESSTVPADVVGEPWDGQRGMVISFVVVRNTAAIVGGHFRAANAMLLSIPMTSRSGMSKHPDYKISLGLLQENWRQLIEVYQQLVWDSRELAGEAQALATDFVQIFWPRFLDSNVHLSIKLVELRDYARGIEDQAVHSKRVRSAFTTLTERVAACQIDYSSLAPEYNLSLKHQDLRNRFKWILNEIEPPRDEIFEGKGAFFVVRSLAPMLQRENVVPLYLMDNDSVCDAHSVLSTKILAIASISTAIRVDFQRLSTHIDDKSKHIDVDENGSFQHDLHYDLLRIKTFYEALVEALKDYQVNVVSPNAEV